MSNMFNTEPTILVLDAMGVIYQAANDVDDLLVPFVRDRASTTVEQIDREYLAASLGEIDAAEFWRRVGVDAALEDQYLALHSVTAGLAEFLTAAKRMHRQICCLSNDISSWSLKLRKKFNLERDIGPFVISGDVRVRKPQPEIYRHLLYTLNAPAEQLLFVDDRPRNLDAAAELGFQTVLFDPSRAALDTGHRRIAQLPELLQRARR